MKHPSEPTVARARAGTGLAPGVDKTLTKGLLLIEALCRSPGSRGVSDLASELSLTKSNVHRLLQTLISSGFVSREAGSDRYILTSKLWRLSRLQRPHDTLAASVRPLLSELVTLTGETASFAIVEDNTVVWIDQVETRHTVRVYFSVGDSHPLDQVVKSGRGVGAFQQVAYAFRPEAEVRRSLEAIGRDLGRPATFVDEQVARVQAVRRDGYAVVEGEWIDGVNAVAAAVRGRVGDLVGIVISFGPAHRLTGGTLDLVRRATCDMAVRLTNTLFGAGTSA